MSTTVTATSTICRAGTIARDGAGSSMRMGISPQDKAKRENAGEGQAVTGQSQAVADAAYNAESFNEFFNLRNAETRQSFLWSIGLSAVGGGLGGGLSFGGNQSISFSFPTGSAFQDLVLGAGISFGTSMMQILIDPIVTGQTGGKQ